MCGVVRNIMVLYRERGIQVRLRCNLGKKAALPTSHTWRFSLDIILFWGWHSVFQFCPCVCECVCFCCEGVCVSGPQKQMPARSSVGSSWRALRPASLRSSVFGSQEHPRVSPGFLTPTPRDYSNSCACDKKVEVSKLEDHSQSILLESLAESFLNATRSRCGCVHRSHLKYLDSQGISVD